MVTRSKKEGDNPVLKVVLLENEQQFPFYPDGFHGVSRQNYGKPITSSEGSTNLIMPLLRPYNIRLAKPNRNMVSSQNLSEAACKISILERMRQEYFFWQH